MTSRINLLMNYYNQFKRILFNKKLIKKYNKMQLSNK